MWFLADFLVVHVTYIYLFLKIKRSIEKNIFVNNFSILLRKKYVKLAVVHIPNKRKLINNDIRKWARILIDSHRQRGGSNEIYRWISIIGVIDKGKRTRRNASQIAFNSSSRGKRTPKKTPVPLNYFPMVAARFNRISTNRSSPPSPLALTVPPLLQAE